MRWVALLVLVACGDHAATPRDAAVDGAAGKPQLDITGAFADFGTVGVSQSLTNHFVVTNSGAATAQSLVIGVTGMYFTQTATSCVTSLAAGATCGVDVVFAPQTDGVQSGSLHVAATDAASATLALHGTGVPFDDIFSISPTGYDFGEIAVGASSSSQTVTVQNVGPSAKGPFVLSISGSDPTAFATVNDGCSGVVIAASATCTFGVELAPGAAGDKQASVTVTQPNGFSQSIAVSGRGGPGLPDLAFSPASHDFGSLGLDVLSPPVVLTLTNVGTGATSSLGGTSSFGSDFRWSSDCNALAAGASCSITAYFEPTVVGARSATVTVTSSNAPPASAPLTGTGVATPDPRP